MSGNLLSERLFSPLSKLDCGGVLHASASKRGGKCGHVCVRVGTCACVHCSVSTCGCAGITINLCLRGNRALFHLCLGDVTFRLQGKRFQCCTVNSYHSLVWKPLACHFLLLAHDRRPTHSPNQALMRAAQRSCMAEELFEVVCW